MNNLANRISHLISKHLNDELNDEEKQELNEWVQQSEDHQLFFRQFIDDEAFAETLEEYDTSKGTIRFPAEKPLPSALVQKLVKLRMAKIRD